MWKQVLNVEDDREANINEVGDRLAGASVRTVK